MRSRGAARKIASPGLKAIEGKPRLRGRRLAIVVSRYHGEITSKLLQGALRAVKEVGGKVSDADVCYVPGSFELGLATHRLARSGRYVAVVALGCLIQGETIHMDVIAREVTRSLGETQRATGIPVGFGLLTVNNLDQAIARAGGSEGNKGDEAVKAALMMADLLSRVG